MSVRQGLGAAGAVMAENRTTSAVSSQGALLVLQLVGLRNYGKLAQGEGLEPPTPRHGITCGVLYQLSYP